MNSPYMPLPQRRPAGLLDEQEQQAGGGYEPRQATPWDSMNDSQKAAYYAANPTMAAITQIGQNLFGHTSLGMLQGLMAPGFVADQRAIARPNDPMTAGAYGFGGDGGGGGWSGISSGYDGGMSSNGFGSIGGQGDPSSGMGI